MGKTVIDLPQGRHAVSVNFNLPPGQTYFRTHLSFPFDVGVCKREGKNILAEKAWSGLEIIVFGAQMEDLA